MEIGYMVVAKDGQEYGPLDRDTIQRWYYEGRLDQNSRVYEPGQHKFRLKEMFDLTVWNNPALVNQAASASTAEPLFMPKSLSEMTGDVGEPTPGMFAAGILLVVNAVMGLLSIGLILVLKLGAPDSPRYYVTPVVDLIVAAGLIRGNERFRKWGLARAVLGGVYFVVSALFRSSMSSASAPTLDGWIEVFFQLMFCAGIAALLWGDWPSKIRVGVGTGVVLLAWAGIITTGAVSLVVRGVQEQRAFEKYALEAAGFEDTKLGVTARLPEGWALLTKDNPIVSLPDASLVAMHKKTGCLAALMVERDPLGGGSLDDYLSLVLENRQNGTPSMKEVARADDELGGRPARRLETSWTTGGKRLRGFATTCKVGFNYYLLTGWCFDEAYSKAFRAFQALEKAFEIGIGAAQEPPEITSESEEDFYDLVFFIKDHKKLADGTQTILALGTHEGKEVGFEVSLAPAWKPFSLGKDLSATAFSGSARYRSIGSESDSLLEILDQLYGTQQSPNRMAKETRFTVISLAGDPRELEEAPVRMKLFFEAASEDRYAEVYTNIDLRMRKLYVSEKDPEYRAAIIRALRAH